jgi:hypothetical protein
MNGQTNSTPVAENNKRVIIEANAWGWYNNPLSLGGVRPRNWLPLTLIADYSDALGGKALTLGDLQLLVLPDGGKEVCAGCGQEFQPVRFAAPSKSVLRALEGGKQIGELNGEVSWEGSFIVKGYSLIPFCGSLFYFNPNRKEGMGEYFEINRATCLGKAYNRPENMNSNSHRPNHTHSRESAQALLARWKREEEQSRRREREVERGIADAFNQAASGRRSRR